MEAQASSATTSGSDSSSDSGEVTEVQEGAAKAGAKGEAVKAESDEDLSPEMLDRKVTIKIDGKDHRMTVKEAMKLQQLEQASRQKITQAQKMEQRVRGLLQQIDDPKEYFKLKGIDVAEFAEATLSEKLQMLQESPEQKELRELREYRSHKEEREKAAKEAQEKEHMSRAEVKAQEGFNKEFVEAWQSTGLPSDRLFGQFLAAEMVSANARGEDLSWKDAAGKVKGKLITTVSSMFSQMDAEAIQGILGPKVLKALRDFEVKRVSSGTAASGLNVSQGPGKNAASEGNPKQKKVLNEREWEEYWLKS